MRTKLASALSPDPPTSTPSLSLPLGYGGLGLSIEGPSKVDINCEDVEDGTCKVTYCPTEPGNYIINIKFAEQHVPGTHPAAGNDVIAEGRSD